MTLRTLGAVSSAARRLASLGDQQRLLVPEAASRAEQSHNLFLA